MPAPSIDIRRIGFAHRLLELGVRPHLVAHTMGLPQTTVVTWYQQINGIRTSRGPLKTCSASYLKTRADAQLLSVFCAFYLNHRVSGEPSSAEQLIDAIEKTLTLTGREIDGNMAWMAARELDTGVLQLRYCPVCKLHHVYYLQSLVLRKCPFCAPTTGSPRRRKRTAEPEAEAGAIPGSGAEQISVATGA